MLCKDNMANLENNAKHIFPSFSLFILFFIIIFFNEKKKKKSQNEMHKYYAMQILKKQIKQNNKEEWSQRIEQ